MSIGEQILKAYEPTEEDISKELTNEQLVKLCQRNRCRVDMWKWNVVEDFAQNFRDAGRLEGKSQKFIHKLLIKAYMRNQDLFTQAEKEKDEERGLEWAFRKKNSLLQLDLWEYEENMQNEVEQIDNEEEMSASEEREVLLQEYTATHSSSAINVDKTSNYDEELIDVGKETEAFAVKVIAIFPSIENDQNRKKEESLQKEYNFLNSESVAISTQNLTDGIDELPEQSNEESFPLNISELKEPPLQPFFATQSQTYDEFNEKMPLTSTQDADILFPMPVLCLGPKRAGKSHLLKALQDNKAIDETSYSVPTIGTSIYNIRFPHKSTSAQTSSVEAVKSTTSTTNAATNNMKTSHHLKNPSKSIRVMEIGGTMAPLWRQYFDDVEKIIYVVDTSNLCQISAAGVLLYSILAEPRLQKVKFLLVLSKMDYAYRQMRNEALLMLQMSKLQKQIRQNITIVEASSVTRDGFDKIYDWLQMP